MQIWQCPIHNSTLVWSSICFTTVPLYDQVFVSQQYPCLIKYFFHNSILVWSSICSTTVLLSDQVFVSKQYPCLIKFLFHNSTLVWSSISEISFSVFCLKVTCAFILQESILELLKLNTLKPRGTIVNKAFSSFHGESLEITFTVPLIRHHINTEYNFQYVRKRENKFFVKRFSGQNLTQSRNIYRIPNM